MIHRYVSTYCQHDLCVDCRLTCKHCQAPCLCPCHDRTEAACPQPGHSMHSDTL